MVTLPGLVALNLLIGPFLKSPELWNLRSELWNLRCELCQSRSDFVWALCQPCSELCQGFLKIVTSFLKFVYSNIYSGILDYLLESRLFTFHP